MSKTSKNGTFGASLLMLLAALIWGSSFVAQEKGLEQIPNFTFLAVRSWLAVLALLPVALIPHFREKARLARAGETPKPFFTKDLLKGCIVCGFALCAATACQQIGIAHAGAGKSGFLTALYILMVPLIGLVVYRRRVSPLLWACVAIALVGMYFLCVSDTGRMTLWDWLLIACAFGFSVQITAVDRYLAKGVDGVRLSLMQFVVCAVLSTVAMLVLEKTDPAALLGAWFPVFYAGVLSSGVAFTLQIQSQKTLSPTIATLLMSLESVFAALGGAVFGERLTPFQLLGCALVFVAVVFAQLPIGRKKPKTA